MIWFYSQDLGEKHNLKNTVNAHYLDWSGIQNKDLVQFSDQFTARIRKPDKMRGFQTLHLLYDLNTEPLFRCLLWPETRLVKVQVWEESGIGMPMLFCQNCENLKSLLVWILYGRKEFGLQMVRISNGIWNHLKFRCSPVIRCSILTQVKSAINCVINGLCITSTSWLMTMAE